MRLTIFGSTGKLGRIVVDLALQRGHQVTAFVRNGEPSFPPTDRLEIAQGDVYQAETVATAIRGHEAVLSTLGMPLFGRQHICADGMKNIVPAMERNGVRRLLAISAFGARENRNLNFYTRHLRWVVPNQMADKDEMEEVIRASSLDWTIIRPAAYLDLLPAAARQREVLQGTYPFVARRAVAGMMLDLLDDHRSYRQAIAVEYGHA